jgi:uncharacterized protein (DUF1800 family)
MGRWILAAALTMSAAWGAVNTAQAAPLQGEQAALHVLNRMAYGPRPGDIERVTQMGVERYLDEQLNPPPLPAALAQRLDGLETQKLGAGAALEELRLVQAAAKKDKDEAMEMRRDTVRQLMLETSEARLLRAVESPRQLEEVMVDFWFNHFNVFQGKGQDRVLVSSYERDAIRPHVFGRFRDLLGATAKHPAMLFYLDNWVSKADGLNENYARELMELHTLGVDNGYKQQDVTELARMLTGWTYAPKRMIQRNETFVFDPKRHDNGSKQWLGVTVAPRGQAEGEMALDVLAAHPSTARRISFKLAQYFVSDTPPQALVERMARTWRDSGGEIRAVLRTMFTSPEFMDQAVAGAKFKTPYQFVVSATRASGAPVTDVKPMLAALSRLGQPLYGCQTPDGYKNTQDAWLNPDALTRRIAFATTLTQGSDPQQVQAALGASVSPRTAALVATSPDKVRAAMLLGGPDFMQR